MSPRQLPPAVPVAVLRVYEPEEVFPAERRVRWRREVARPDAAERAAEAERQESWRRLLRGSRSRYPLARPGPGPGRGGVPQGHGADSLAGHVRVLRIDSALLLCPASVGDGERPRRVLVRAWDLPLPWMAVVALSAVPSPADERLGDGRGDGPREGPGDRGRDGARSAGGGGEIGHYLDPMAMVRGQAARVLRTLRVTMRGTEITAEVEVLARWLEGFHPRSWLELDLRDVVLLLDGDDGLDDVRLGLECLASGDRAGAGLAYQRLRRRSQALTDISRLS